MTPATGTLAETAIAPQPLAPASRPFADPASGTGAHAIPAHAIPDGVISLPTTRVTANMTIVIPAFNEEAAIGDVVRDVRQALGDDADIVVVDDGSTDGTASAADECGARAVRIPRNSGNGSAVKAGIRAAHGDFIAFMDGDGQHRADDLLRLLPYVGPYDMVVGARDSAGQASRLRRWANAFYNRLAGYMTGRDVKDLTSGFRIVRRRVAEEFLPLLPNGFSYPTTITLASMRAGYSVAYVPIQARRRTGKSKIHLIRDGGKFLIIMFKIITLFSPLKVFLPLAVLPAVFAMLTFAMSATGLVGLWTISTLLLTSALTLIGLGLVSEQICAMRFERLNLLVEQRPWARGNGR